MTKEGPSPDIDSYCLLTQAAVAAKDRDAAESAFGEVRRRVSALSDGQGEELGERGGGGGERGGGKGGGGGGGGGGRFIQSKSDEGGRQVPVIVQNTQAMLTRFLSLSKSSQPPGGPGVGGGTGV
jgi:hypothetical protein